MKKKLFTSLILILLSFATFAQNEKEPYVVINDGTATFYYKDKDSKPTGALGIRISYEDANWSDEIISSIKIVSFDESFAYYEPTSCADWFYHFSNLTEIKGIKDNLKTSKVTSMRGMFEGCSSLQSLDLSGLNTLNVRYMTDMFAFCTSLSELNLKGFSTESVESMAQMFIGCSSLTSLDVSSFYTFYVQDMRDMFRNCSNLKNLNLQSFRTSNVTNMSRMFQGCHNLTRIGFSPSGFNTSKVTKMSQMFDGCWNLDNLDLSGFNTKKVVDMSYMFNYCLRLRYILVGDDWSIDAVTNSYAMFSLNELLFGEKGTGAGQSFYDASYAKVDGGKDSPGFFTKSGTIVYDPAYAIVKDGTATFYFGAYKPNGSLPMRTEESDKNWTSAIYSTITKVVFDDSFKSFKPYKTSYWFEGFDQLTEIVGMRENLNTSEVVYMNSMFHFCDNLTSIDVSGFDTGMVEDMSLMFYGCENLKSINLSSFNTANVTKMQYMFGVCNNLRSIFVGNDWSTASVTKSDEMFYECNNLYGGKGTSPKTIDVI